MKKELKKTGKKSRKLKKLKEIGKILKEIGKKTQGNRKKNLKDFSQKLGATEAQCLNEPPLCVEK